ncbi:hypothetical protein HDV01_005344 [Terramyces sp. JEL0728]|nr:hypothetical protein HDV01_005344 [Terramyces sp. JEL0728]
MTERPKSAATRPKTQISSIGHYDLDKNIGEGNFAKVRLAKHTITGQQVAIKIIDKAKLDKATSKKLFREVRIMRLLNHKNIVKLYEVIDTPDELFLVMEYVSGGEIFDYLVAHGRMKEKEARKHFRQIIGAVAHCHQLHIIHRDLKAENLLLDENMNVKIADFGFSNQFSPGQKLNTWCGSPPYAAPELFQGKEYSGPEVDIWSLGVVLYVLVCGSLPFDGSNLAKLRARLIKKMLVIDPAKRATVEQILQDKWYSEGFENEPPQQIGIAATSISPELHQKVLDELEELGLEKAAVQKSLNEGLYDSLTATYYLIADRRLNNASSPSKSATPTAKPQKPNRQTDLEMLNEEENDEKPGAEKPQEKAAAPAPITTQSTAPPPPSSAPPTKVVAGRRRAATSTNAAASPISQEKLDANTVNSPEQLGPSDLPPARGGKVPLAGKKNIGVEFKDVPAQQTAANPPEVPAALPPIPVVRARAHTMATEKRDDEEQTIPIDQFKAHLKDSNEPRTARFTFSVSTTSTKEPEAVFNIVTKVVKDAGAQCQTTGMVAKCKLNDIEFEIEVCKLPNLQVVGLRCKRLAGGAWDYKEMDQISRIANTNKIIFVDFLIFVTSVCKCTEIYFCLSLSADVLFACEIGPTDFDKMSSYTRQEVATHSSDKSAWIIIDSIVYDITKFASLHPGGELLILEHAGKDATEIFYAFHRQDVLQKYKRLQIGSITNEKQQIIQNTPGSISQVPYAEPSSLQGFHSPYFNESHKKFRQAVRHFVQTEILPEAASFDDAGKVASKEMFKKMGEFGLLATRMGPGPHLKAFKLPGGVKPEEFDYFHEQIAHEEVCTLGYPGYQDSLGTGMVIGLPPVMNFARKEVRDKVVREVLTGQKTISLAISEPNAGSDVAAIATTAVKTPDGKHYIVNGVKKWITNGSFSDYFSTAVLTGKGHGGISMLLIERTEGVETKGIKTSYSSSAGTAYIIFENVKVPVENLLGKEGGGFLFNFNHERWFIVAGMVAASRKIVEECFKWANQRKVFGKSLLEQPVIRNKLAHMVSQVESTNNWLENITYQMTKMSYKEAAIKLGGPIALLKLLSTRVAHNVADESCQIFGGRGITKTGMGRYVEGFQRTYKFGAILGGSEEIMADLGIRQAMRNFPDARL